MSIPHQLIAAVDMGSSSFRMIVARVENLDNHSQIYIIDSLREPVRLGAGLTEDKRLDTASQERGLNALRRFGERLRSFKPNEVRAVATNAVRVARNASEFIAKAEVALGFPIDIISGVEEARLVYCGVAHQLPIGQGRRLVIDIGGGSTEFIIGEDYKPEAMESLYIGCVSTAQQYFADGSISPKAMKNAIMAARKEVAVLRRQIIDMGWTHAIGSSGTARALAEICTSNGFTQHGISAQALRLIREHVTAAGHLNDITLEGLKIDRLPMMPGGLAVMSAVFEELEIEQLEVTDGALRQGLLYDMLGRQHHNDMREITVAQFIHRYKIDKRHANKVKELAEVLLINALSQQSTKALYSQIDLLKWAALLHEIGLSIGHNGHHKHAAYILSNADMPGFSKREQILLSTWVLAHNGKLGKVSSLTNSLDQWVAPMCLRLATLFLRRREIEALPDLHVKLLNHGLQISLPKDWLLDHPLTQYSLETEVEQWQRIGLTLEVTTRK
jgi:exopolyphosphatase/guanosine-5'-triphosphate,3'-diphosphate pyrophosphatase